MARNRRPEDHDKDDRRGRRKEKDDRADDKAEAKRKSRSPHPGTVTESLKAKSHQSDEQAMKAAPGLYPAEPANAEAVYTTGPGQAVEYNYARQGTYAEDYAAQQTVKVQGDPVTGTGAAGFTPGAANNPT